MAPVPTPSILGEELFELGRPSRPTSPWTTLSSIFQGRGGRTPRPDSMYSRLRGESWSSTSRSKIPIPVGSERYPSFKFYSDIGQEPSEEQLLDEQRLRFADPSPTVKDLHVNVDDPVNDSGIGENAAIFSNYVEEAQECDQEMISGLDGSLDVLLIFTGLFSAVLAALIIESYKMLQPSSQDETTRLLQGILGALDPSQRPDLPINTPATPFVPSNSAIRVNAVWFAALSLTLAVAVQVMLAKQWLHKYGEGLSSSPRLHTELRQYRYDSLQAWHLPEIVNMLPTMLHLALALFLLGLIDFLWQLNRLVAGVTLSICLLSGGSYIMIMILPHIYTGCPYRTALSRLLGVAYYRIRCLIHDFRPDLVPRPRNVPIEQAERKATELNRGTLQAKALAWLMMYTRKSDVLASVTRSMASLKPEFPGIDILRKAGAIRKVAEHFLECFTEHRHPTSHVEGVSEFKLIETMSEPAGLYARSLYRLVETLPASRWPARPPRELNLYADALDAALSELSAKTDDAEVVAFSIAAREHIFRAGRNRFPNGNTGQPNHSLGDLLEIVSKVAEDELVPGVAGVVCLLDTTRRCVDAIDMMHRYSVWVNDFSIPLLSILRESPPGCQVRLAMSRCIACFASIDSNRDYSEGHNPVEHRLLVALSSLLVRSIQNGHIELAEQTAEMLESVIQDYSRSFILFIRPLREILSALVPILSSSAPTTIKSCVLRVSQHADLEDFPQGTLKTLVTLLVDEGQTDIHTDITLVLERHMHREEIHPILIHSGAIQSLIRHLNSPDLSLAAHSSAVLVELCKAQILSSTAKHPRTATLSRFVLAGLLPSLATYFSTRAAAEASDSEGSENRWVPILLALLDSHAQDVLKSSVFPAYLEFQIKAPDDIDLSEHHRNLRDWWTECDSWLRSGVGSKPRPRGSLYVLD